jgi:dTDP-4-dehydrorhamnose reductase
VSRPLLVTGGSGCLGGALLAQATSPVVATQLRGDSVELTRLDVRDAEATAALVARLRPAAVIHTAYVQAGPEAWATNVEGSRNVATAAARAGLRLVHVSTDVVFDGLKGSPYDEGDQPNPVTDYGRSKLEAERFVLDAHPDELACRIAAAHGLAADRIGRGRVADSGLVRPMDCTLDASRARGLLASTIGPVRP